MGFRSNFIAASNIEIELPEWFLTKWKDHVHFREEKFFPISSKYEAKTYWGWKDLIPDIKTTIDECDKKIILFFIHECGGITRIEISNDEVLMSEPSLWKKCEEIEHHYCYGCSDYENAV